MKRFGAVNSKRLASSIMSIVMLAFVLLSILFIAAEAEHDCSGDDCPICALIQQCENALRGLYHAAITIFAALTALSVSLCGMIFSQSIARETPVSNKVRLKN